LAPLTKIYQQDQHSAVCFVLDVDKNELLFVEQQRHIADGVVKSCDVGDDDATAVVERRSAPGHVDTKTSKPRQAKSLVFRKTLGYKR
jgi:hypothetical protein